MFELALLHVNLLSFHLYMWTVVHVVHSEVAPVSTVWFLAVGCFVASLILMVILPAVGSVAVYRRERRALVFPVQN